MKEFAKVYRILKNVFRMQQVMFSWLVHRTDTAFLKISLSAPLGR